MVDDDEVVVGLRVLMAPWAIAWRERGDVVVLGGDVRS